MQLKRKYENATRQTIVKCAARLFADHGFHGTGVREIVDKAGVALNSVNYYFGSKENLFLESIKYVLKEKIQFDQLFPPTEKVPDKPQQLSNYTKKKVSGIFDILFGTNRRYWYADMITRAFQDDVPEAMEVAMIYMKVIFNKFAEIYEKAHGKMDEKAYFSWMARFWFEILGCTIWRNIFGYEFNFPGYQATDDRDVFIKSMESKIVESTLRDLNLPKAK